MALNGNLLKASIKFTLTRQQFVNKTTPRKYPGQYLNWGYILGVIAEVCWDMDNMYTQVGIDGCWDCMFIMLQ
jgi:hypothetical protein